MSWIYKNNVHLNLILYNNFYLKMSQNRNLVLDSINQNETRSRSVIGENKEFQLP